VIYDRVRTPAGALRPSDHHVQVKAMLDTDADPDATRVPPLPGVLDVASA
jgi:hypothetical protein